MLREEVPVDALDTLSWWRGEGPWAEVVRERYQPEIEAFEGMIVLAADEIEAQTDADAARALEANAHHEHSAAANRRARRAAKPGKAKAGTVGSARAGGKKKKRKKR